jgi:hypothetical protein
MILPMSAVRHHGSPRRSDSDARRAALVALVAAVLLLALPGLAGPVLAATDDLRIQADATYIVDPGAGTVGVTIDVRATNEKPDAVTTIGRTRYYYTEVVLPVQDEAVGIAARDSRGSLRTTTAQRDGYKLVTIRFRSAIYYRESAALTLAYDLPGGAPRSPGDIRVGRAFVSFYLWAFGDDGQGSVRAVIPAGFSVATYGDALTVTSKDGSTVLTASAIAKPYDWSASVDAANDAALSESRISLGSGLQLVVRAWPEDPVWQSTVSSILKRGVPALQSAVGLAWPVEGDLTVTEVQRLALEGYAGLYHTDTDTIEISEDLDPLTILHEATHAWFNDALFAERWIDEGLADTYGARALPRVGEAAQSPETPSRTDPGFVPLDAWAFPGRIADTETDQREAYGYNAAWWLVDRIVGEIGEARMRAVFSAADGNRIAYVGSGAAETVAAGDDWRRFLDLLEQVGGSTQATSLFRQWVVTADQQPLLDQRQDARAAYAALQAEAGAGWGQPYLIRGALSAWSFATATQAIDEAETLLARRDQIAATATDLGVTPNGDLERAYETATTSFDSVRSIEDSLQSALDRLATARAALDAPRDLFATVGLIGEEPDMAWDRAAQAFGDGDLEAVGPAADEAASIVTGAADAGRVRVAVGAVVIVLLGGLPIVLLVRRRRRARQQPAPAVEAVVAAGPAPVDWVVPGSPPDPGRAPAPESTGYTTDPGPESDAGPATSPGSETREP